MLHKPQADIKLIKLPCSGRFETGFGLSALQKGSDAVLVITCKKDDCHYKVGVEIAEKRVAVAKQILHTLGIQPDLIDIIQIAPSDAYKIDDMIKRFAEQKKLEKLKKFEIKSTVKSSHTLKNAFEFTSAYYCVGCGKCTANCNVAIFDQSYGPRIIVERASALQYTDVNAVYRDTNLWKCYTCAACYTYCPHNVKFYEFIRYLRHGALAQGIKVECAQANALQSIFKIMATYKLKQRRFENLNKKLRFCVAKKADILYFTGCTQYLNILFPFANTNAIVNTTLAVLNKLNITPVLLPDEVCCGHDMLWLGDVEYFKKLALQNIEMIKKVSPKTIIFSCPECYRTFKIDYTTYFGDLWADTELLHISEFLDKQIDNLWFTKTSEKIVYQDACRLGRHLNVYEQPRKILSKITTNFVEFERTKSKSTCCGATAWIACNSNSMLLQKIRIQDAARIAQKFITACPKCTIHFKCAFNSMAQKPDIEIEDFTVFVSKHLNPRRVDVRSND